MALVDQESEPLIKNIFDCSERSNINESIEEEVDKNSGRYAGQKQMLSKRDRSKLGEQSTQLVL